MRRCLSGIARSGSLLRSLTGWRTEAVAAAERASISYACAQSPKATLLFCLAQASWSAKRTEVQGADRLTPNPEAAATEYRHHLGEIICSSSSLLSGKKIEPTIAGQLAGRCPAMIATSEQRHFSMLTKASPDALRQKTSTQIAPRPPTAGALDGQGRIIKALLNSRFRLLIVDARGVTVAGTRDALATTPCGSVRDSAAVEPRKSGV